ncbi:MAG: hypothetical protein IKF19_04390 [Bacilli bacterium]|nr:hypothetical protein [Bacilli bacterium]
MEFRNNINNRSNMNNNIMKDRTDDLTKIFDRKYHANHDVNGDVQQRKKEFNEKFFGIRDKEDIRRELREANSVNGKVENLKNKISGMQSNNFDKGGFR